MQKEIAGIKAFDIDGIEHIVEKLGQPKYRAAQLVSWIYGKHAHSYDEMTNLPKTFRAELSKEFPLYNAKILETLHSADGARKYIIQYADDCKVETVGIPSGKRLTVCFSTQVGCAMGCSFCATAKQGFTRNLAPGEIFDQVALVAADFEMNPTNAVAMGQGEPFQNYDASVGALDLLNSENGMNIGARHLTISTCGIVSMIKKFASQPKQYTLAISLHSAIQSKRNDLMPVLKKNDLAKLHDAIEVYTKNTKRRPSFEYAMINKINDGEDDLDALIAFCKDTLCHVNLIPLNPTDNKGFSPSHPERTQHFFKTLNSFGIETTIRQSRGADIQGACGQLINS